MSGFEINFYSRKQEFHRFSTEDFALIEMGIGSYTTSSLASFLGLNPINFAAQLPVNPDIAEFFKDDRTVLFNNLVGITTAPLMSILEFDDSDLTYKYKLGFNEITNLKPTRYKSDKFTPPAKDIKTFLSKWNDIQLGVEKDQKIIDGYRAVAYKIQNSASGCIVFNPTLKVLDDATNRMPLIRLYLLESADSESHRTISYKGSPLISAVPRRPYDATYGFRTTETSPPGVYISQSNDGDDNPENTVSGRIRTVWDPSTGEFESGTQQMIARLLDDIDAADVPELSPSGLLGLSSDAVYGAGLAGDGFMGNFTWGTAIPLSAENGNPYMFGPDFKDGCEGDKQVKIKVINRFNQSYKAGSLVVVSRMLGENGNWVIVSQGTPKDTRKMNFGNFEYQQFLIRTDYYFNILDSNTKMTPSKYLSVIRDNFYINLSENFDLVFRGNTDGVSNNESLITKINIVASNMPSDTEDPSKFIVNKLLLENALVVTWVQNAQKNSTNLVYNIVTPSNTLKSTNVLIRGTHDFNFSLTTKEYSVPGEALPKNVLNKKARSMLAIPGSNQENFPIAVGSNDPLYALEVPMFWGFLFPDGYTKASCQRIKSSIDPIIPTYDDPNLLEMSALATSSYPDLGNDLENYLFILKQTNAGDISYYLPFITKNGGIFTNYINEDLHVRTLPQLINKRYGRSDPVISNRISNDGHWGLQPLKPSRIQFSPLSIDALYINSLLNNIEFTNLNTFQTYLQNFTYGQANGWSSINLKDYGKFIIDKASPSNAAQASLLPNNLEWNDIGNTYNSPLLIYKEAFGYHVDGTPNVGLFQRHPAPEGIASDIIPPPLNNGGTPRSPVVAVLTCKSNIKTSSNGLSFTVNQLLGMSPKVVFPSQQPPTLTALPLGAGVAWSNGTETPFKQYSTPQWGDRNRTDDIDSFGTSSLHVRVFEAWPKNQTIYLGHFFTPLHFNEYQPQKIEFITNANGGISSRIATDDDGNNITAGFLETDFRVPTSTDLSAIANGTTITQSGLAPYGDWRWNTIRQGKLLSGGGFAYLQSVIAVSSCTLDTSDPKNRGSGYEEGDILTFADGSKITVTSLFQNPELGIVNGIGGITFESNIVDIENRKVIKDQSLGLTSASVSPSYNGSGSGAKFITTFVVVDRIGYDPAPKEVIPITRLTKPSDGGNSIAEGIKTTSIDFAPTDKKSFDIFYFFHNDPTHYSMDRNLAHNGAWAQYAIVEVNPL